MWKTLSDKFASGFTIVAVVVVISFPFLVSVLVWIRQKQLWYQKSVERYGAILQGMVLCSDSIDHIPLHSLDQLHYFGQAFCEPFAEQA